MDRLNLEYRAVTDLHAASRNARTHSAKQVSKLVRSIKQYGFLIPLVVDDELTVVAGHARLEAARKAKLTEVPVVLVSHLSPDQLKAFALADNRIPEDGGWSRKVLGEIMVELDEADLPDFALTDTGFDTAELDQIFNPDASEEPPEAEVDRDEPAVTRIGDVWRIGDHKIVCGDARDASCYRDLLGNERAQLVVTDAPYNLKIDGMVSGLGSFQHAEFPMASGEMSPADFTAFLSDVAARLVEASSDGSIHFIFMDFRHMQQLLAGVSPHYTEFKNLCVWVKRSGGMGSLFRSQHELVFVFKSGTARHINNVELGKHGRNRTNVWQYAGATPSANNAIS